MQIHFEDARFDLDLFNFFFERFIPFFLSKDFTLDNEIYKDVRKFFFFWFSSGKFGTEFLKFLNQVLSLFKQKLFYLVLLFVNFLSKSLKDSNRLVSFTLKSSILAYS